MRSLTPHQVTGLTKYARDPGSETREDAAKRLDVGLSTVDKWRKKLRKDKSTEPKKYKKRNTTAILLADLVKAQLDSDPSYLRECIKLLNFDNILSQGI